MLSSCRVHHANISAMWGMIELERSEETCLTARAVVSRGMTAAEGKAPPFRRVIRPCWADLSVVMVREHESTRLT